MNQPKLVLLDPTYEAFTADLGKHNARAIAPPPKSLTSLRLGLLSNGKKNGVELLDALFAELARRPGMAVEKVMTVIKPSISVPPTEGDMARLISDTDVVITAIGD